MINLFLMLHIYIFLLYYVFILVEMLWRPRIHGLDEHDLLFRKQICARLLLSLGY